MGRFEPELNRGTRATRTLTAGIRAIPGDWGDFRPAGRMRRRPETPRPAAGGNSRGRVAGVNMLTRGRVGSVAWDHLSGSGAGRRAGAGAGAGAAIAGSTVAKTVPAGWGIRYTSTRRLAAAPPRAGFGTIGRVSP